MNHNPLHTNMNTRLIQVDDPNKLSEADRKAIFGIWVFNILGYKINTNFIQLMYIDVYGHLIGKQIMKFHSAIHNLNELLKWDKLFFASDSRIFAWSLLLHDIKYLTDKYKDCDVEYIYLLHAFFIEFLDKRNVGISDNDSNNICDQLNDIFFGEQSPIYTNYLDRKKTLVDADHNSDNYKRDITLFRDAINENMSYCFLRDDELRKRSKQHNKSSLVEKPAEIINQYKIKQDKDSDFGDKRSVLRIIFPEKLEFFCFNIYSTFRDNKIGKYLKHNIYFFEYIIYALFMHISKLNRQTIRDTNFFPLSVKLYRCVVADPEEYEDPVQISSTLNLDNELYNIWLLNILGYTQINYMIRNCMNQVNAMHYDTCAPLFATYFTDQVLKEKFSDQYDILFAWSLFLFNEETFVDKYKAWILAFFSFICKRCRLVNIFTRDIKSIYVQLYHFFFLDNTHAENLRRFSNSRNAGNFCEYIIENLHYTLSGKETYPFKRELKNEPRQFIRTDTQEDSIFGNVLEPNAVICPNALENQFRNKTQNEKIILVKENKNYATYIRNTSTNPGSNTNVPKAPSTTNPVIESGSSKANRAKSDAVTIAELNILGYTNPQPLDPHGDVFQYYFTANAEHTDVPYLTRLESDNSKYVIAEYCVYDPFKNELLIFNPDDTDYKSSMDKLKTSMYAKLNEQINPRFRKEKPKETRRQENEAPNRKREVNQEQISTTRQAAAVTTSEDKQQPRRSERIKKLEAIKKPSAKASKDSKQGNKSEDDEPVTFSLGDLKKYGFTDPKPLPKKNGPWEVQFTFSEKRRKKRFDGIIQNNGKWVPADFCVYDPYQRELCCFYSGDEEKIKQLVENMKSEILDSVKREEDEGFLVGSDEEEPEKSAHSSSEDSEYVGSSEDSASNRSVNRSVNDIGGTGGGEEDTANNNNEEEEGGTGGRVDDTENDINEEKEDVNESSSEENSRVHASTRGGTQNSDEEEDSESGSEESGDRVRGSTGRGTRRGNSESSSEESGDRVRGSSSRSRRKKGKEQKASIGMDISPVKFTGFIDVKEPLFMDKLQHFSEELLYNLLSLKADSWEINKHTDCTGGDLGTNNGKRCHDVANIELLLETPGANLYLCKYHMAMYSLDDFSEVKYINEGYKVTV